MANNPAGIIRTACANGATDNPFGNLLSRASAIACTCVVCAHACCTCLLQLIADAAAAPPRALCVSIAANAWQKKN